jgi:hypothetical protein
VVANPSAFRERTLAKLRGEVVAPVITHDDTTALGRKRNRNTARNAQRRKAITPWQFRKTLAAFSGKCAYCGASERIEREHFLPLALGGELTVQNCLPSCLPCNRKKRDTHPLLWLMERYGFVGGIGLYAELSAWLAARK